MERELLNVIGDPPRSLPKDAHEFEYTWSYGSGENKKTNKMRAVRAFEIDDYGDGTLLFFRVEQEYGPDDWRYSEHIQYHFNRQSCEWNISDNDWAETPYGPMILAYENLLAKLAVKDARYKAARLEELRGMAKAVCWRCRQSGDAVDDSGEYVHVRSAMPGTSYMILLCEASAIHSRIAELEGCE